MCGIHGILAKSKKNNIKNSLLQALNLLKNRGYDSCGIYLDTNRPRDEPFLQKFGIDDAKPDEDVFTLLDKAIAITNTPFTRGIGHTRWATHGGKTNLNSHPHISPSGRIVIVHNGIISNYHDLKETTLKSYQLRTTTDSEVIAYMIEHLHQQQQPMMETLSQLDRILVGTWACLIVDKQEPNRIYFMKNQTPLLIGENDRAVIFTSEPIGFANTVDKYTLLREHCYGYYDNKGNRVIIGEHKELPLDKLSVNDLTKGEFPHWMRKEISDQLILKVMVDPLTRKPRSNDQGIDLDLEWIKPTKYLYLIGCGSSYYAGLIASNYFRHTKAFELVNVFDGAEFGVEHLEALENPEDDLLVVLISQSGETRDLNLATTICREFSKKKGIDKEIKIVGIINVIGSLISRRTVANIYTNCDRENAVASTKSCTAQIMSCLLLSLYKSNLQSKLDPVLLQRFLSDLKALPTCMSEVLSIETAIIQVAKAILGTESSQRGLFVLGRDEYHGVALEGALKIKEIAYLHAEGFHIASLKHGPYALISDQVPVIIIYKEYNHFIKSVVSELRTRKAMLILVSSQLPDEHEDPVIGIRIPYNETFGGLISVIVMQLLAYHLSILQGINPDMPRNLAKVVTVD